MYEFNGIAYADNPSSLIRVSGIRPLADYRLWVRFTTGESKTIDMKPLLSVPAFEPLKDQAVFCDVYIDYGIPVWLDGDIDIAPEYLYSHGV